MYARLFLLLVAAATVNSLPVSAPPRALVGTWHLVRCEVVRPTGGRLYPYWQPSGRHFGLRLVRAHDGMVGVVGRITPLR